MHDKNKLLKINHHLWSTTITSSINTPNQSPPPSFLPFQSSSPLFIHKFCSFLARHLFFHVRRCWGAVKFASLAVLCGVFVRDEVGEGAGAGRTGGAGRRGKGAGRAWPEVGAHLQCGQGWAVALCFWWLWPGQLPDQWCSCLWCLWVLPCFDFSFWWFCLLKNIDLLR